MSECGVFQFLFDLRNTKIKSKSVMNIHYLLISRLRVVLLCSVKVKLLVFFKGAPTDFQLYLSQNEPCYFGLSYTLCSLQFFIKALYRKGHPPVKVNANVIDSSFILHKRDKDELSRRQESPDPETDQEVSCCSVLDR